MAEYISGDFEADCNIVGKCKISKLYFKNEALREYKAKYTCYNNEECDYKECLANEGNDETYFKLGELTDVIKIDYD